MRHGNMAATHFLSGGRPFLPCQSPGRMAARYSGNAIDWRHTGMSARSMGSPPPKCSQQLFPFVQAAAKAEVTRRQVARPRAHGAAFSALGVMGRGIVAPRRKDMRGEGIVVGPQPGQDGIDLAHCLTESAQSFPKLSHMHSVRLNIRAWRSSQSFAFIREKRDRRAKPYFRFLQTKRASRSGGGDCARRCFSAEAKRSAWVLRVS